MIRLALSTAALIGFAEPAKADWQYTRWGMNPYEVIDAAQGAVQMNIPPGMNTETLRTMMYAPYQAGDINFNAYLYFDKSDKLSMVKMVAEDPSRCTSIVQLLNQTYGPSQNRSTIGRSWRDEKNGNIITFTEIVGCDVSYSPIFTAGRAGGL